MKEKIISLLKAVGYLGLSLIIQLIAATMVMFAIMFRGSADLMSNDLYFEEYMKQMNLIMIIYGIITIIIIMLIFKIRKKSTIKEFGLKTFSKKNILAATVIAISGWLLNSVVLTFMMNANMLSSAFEKFEELSAVLVTGSLFMSILVTGLIVPFVEEFIFRGAIFRTLKKSMSIKYAIIIQAIIFGIAHGNLIQFIYSVFFGCILGYVAYKCKTLWPAIIIHMINNTIAVLATEPLDIILQNNIIAVVILVISVVGLVWGIKDINRRNVEEKEIVEELITN